MKYRNHNLHGLLVVDKPVGVSSMDVVRRVRRAGGHCKTGHAGTLDPLASGVLICCLGRATKAVERLMGRPKTYEASVDLSAFTSTDDSEGEREPIAVDTPPGEAAVREALAGLTGEIEQTPPAHSAIKIGGRRAYQLARAGERVDVPARTVRVDRIDLLDYGWPELRMRVACGRGTYVRSLARQIGEALGVGGHLTALRRAAVGEYTLAGAVALDDLPQPLTQEHLMPTPQGNGREARAAR